MTLDDCYMASPNMKDFCRRMVLLDIQEEQRRQAIRDGRLPRPAPWGTVNISDRH